MESDMREYSVVWLRQGNATPRRKRIGPSRQRAERYLRAVQSTTADERYGDKVDKFKCCDGGNPYDPCACNGLTWREDWDDKFKRLYEDGGIAPLVYARIESRPVAKWEQHNGDGSMPDHKYGDMIAPPEAAKADWMVVDPAKCIILDTATGYLMVYGPRWERRE